MISAIVVNRNCAATLGWCLESLRRSPEAREVLLVDNDSDDGSLQLVRRDFPEVRVLPQARNLGFGAANNLAAAAAEGELLLLVNADAWLEPEALPRLAARLVRQERTALAAPQLRYPDGRLQFTWSPARSVLGEALQKLRNPHEGRACAHGAAFRTLCRVAGRPWYTAACVLVRADAYREVGGFDEDFFMYFEDVDLCRRLEGAGWRLAQEPSAGARHVGGFDRGAAAELYRPSQLRYYARYRPPWERRLLVRRLERRFGEAAVAAWLANAGDS